jgi:uncharacterized membrane protein
MAMQHDTTRSIIVRGRAEDLFGIWMDVERLPKLMKNIVSVTRTGPKTSHWTADGPLGMNVEWDVDTTLVEENKRIGWNTRQNGSITTSGQVTFNQLPDDQTEITVTMKVVPTGGAISRAMLELFANPSKMLDEDLRAFKANVERLTGAGPGQSAGSRHG